ncbi:peptidylprolyl isomerase [Microbacterium bovistercoris]|uniref:Peptidyl-prolyl cis-trans isomerase n=1 Tax=Microbacterium bovistercoris TaxID=2293570 RepID=A0A371NRX6_9MICO|nr:peptidylprolyl isomerase [Microbacterium bovistercoris]REJ04915.1 peptidylprolyl isomerase [Microbacterium bovistercoris]
MPVTSTLLRRSLLALTAAAALTLAGCASNPGSDPASAPSSSASEPAADGTCQYPSDGQAAKQADAPAAEPTVTGEVSATIKTSAGDLAVTLDADKTPCTVNSFLSLAGQSYFDETQCHRLTTDGIFVLQCGDPTGTGTGGPGYSFADELSGDETYEAGTLAMANAGPNTNGSQFFIVYADSQLPPNYTVFGHLDEASTAIVAGIAKDGTVTDDPNGSAPKTPVTLLGVTQN